MHFKRLLTLALALSMVLSVGAAAGFSDKDKIDASLTDEIDLITALGIMQGNLNGTFNPQGTLTRGEAATILYRLNSGKSTIDGSWGEGSLTRFQDVAGHWSAPYVNYCAALGLVEGYTDGSYRPDSLVTAAELAKMLLCVAGYDSDKQGYGTNWPVAVLADASASDMLEEFDSPFTGQVSRQWAAKMLSNLVLRVRTVSYNIYTDTLVPGSTTFGDAKYAVKTAAGILTETNGLKLDTTGTGSVEKTADKLSRLDDTAITFSAPADLLGRRVTVYYRDGGSGLTASCKIYGMTDASASRKITLDQLTVKDGLLYIGGVKTETPVDSLTFYRGLRKAEITLGDTPLADGRPLELVDNTGDGKFDAVLMDNRAAGKVEAYDAAKHIFKSDALGLDISTQEQFKKLSLSAPIAKGDIVAVTEDYSTGKLVYRVEKLSALRTKIGANLAGQKIQIAGKTYQGAAAPVSGFDFSAFCADLTPETLKSNIYDIYTLDGYLVFAEVYSGTSASVALSDKMAYLIAAKGGTAGDAFTSGTADKVQVMFADGSVAVYEYKTPERGACVPFSALSGKNDTVFEYVLNEDGSVYFLRSYTSDDSSKAVVDTSNTPSVPDVHKELHKSSLTLDGQRIFFNDNSFFFVKLHKNGKPVYSVVKASQLQAGADWSGYTMGKHTAYTKDKTGLNTLVFAVISADKETMPGANQTVTGDWFLVTQVASPVITEDGTTWTVTGINSLGQSDTLVLTSDKVGTDGRTIQAGKLYQIKSNKTDRWLDALTPVDSAASAGWSINTVQAATGSMIMLGGELYDLASDAALVYLTQKDDGLALTAGPDLVPHTAGNKVLVHRDSAGRITDLIVLLDGDKAALDITAAIAFGVK